MHATFRCNILQHSEGAGQTHTTHNILQRSKCCEKTLNILKLDPTPSNILPHGMQATMLQDVPLNVACIWPGLIVNEGQNK